MVKYSLVLDLTVGYEFLEYGDDLCVAHLVDALLPSTSVQFSKLLLHLEYSHQIFTGLSRSRMYPLRTRRT